MRIAFMALVLGVVGCGQVQGVCSTTTCSGCCTASGQCVSGAANDACGTSGAQCTNCSSSGRTCVLSICAGGSTGGGGGAGGGTTGGGTTGGGTTGGGSTGGGSTGGGSTGGGSTGGGSACPVAAFPTGLSVSTQYDASGSTAATIARWVFPTQPVTALTIGLEHDGNSIPFTGTFQSSSTASAFLTRCPSDLLSCGTAGTRYFVAVTGSFTFSRADTNTNTGMVRGSLGTIRVVEWDYQAGAPIPGGDCYEIPGAPFEASWP